MLISLCSFPLPGPKKITLLEAIHQPMQPFEYDTELNSKTVLSASSHVPSFISEWTAFNDEAAAFVATLEDTDAVFFGYVPCFDQPTSEDTCLFLCDKHHFPHVNQLASAAGLSGLEFSVSRDRLKKLKVKYACKSLLVCLIKCRP